MTLFSNPLCQNWGHGQPSTGSAPDLVASFDDMSDEHIRAQRTRERNPQQRHHSTIATENGFLTSTSRQYQVSDSQQEEEPAQHLAMNNHRSGQLHHHSGQAIQLLVDGSSGQYDDLTRQLPPRTMIGQPLVDHTHHLSTRANVQPIQSPMNPFPPSTESQVKQEMTSGEYDDHDIFAEFTNGTYHNDNSASAEPQQALQNTRTFNAQTRQDASSIKTGPGAEKQPPIDTMQPAETAEPAAMASHSAVAAPVIHGHGQTVVSSSGSPAEIVAECALTTPSVHSETAPPETPNPSATIDQVDASAQGHAPTAFTGGFGAQPPPKHFAKDPQQHFVSPLAVLGTEKRQRSPSVDSVIASKRHSSEETLSSVRGTDLEANLGLLAEWPRRQNLLRRGALSADTVQANPLLFYGPIPTQQQQGQGPSQGTAGAPIHQHNVFYSSNGVVPNQSPHVKVPQHSSDLVYSSNMQYTPYPMVSQNGQLYAHWMPSGFAFNTLVPHASHPVHPLAQGQSFVSSVDPRPVTEAQEKDGPDASSDDEPLISRAARHHLATVDATASSKSHQSAKPSTNAKKPNSDSRIGVSGGNEDSIIELLDEEEEEAHEPISWKLPDFEATYHPPATDRDLPMAKISTLGQQENLVREEVMLTEDHHQEEMQLFIDVFLPAQQALQTPDPAPAHAVINFHTIAVMVLETFVQYEIGDEVGNETPSQSSTMRDLSRCAGPSTGTSEPARTRSAKDADADDIFFAVVDRWRAGTISGKQTFKLIRGCQEFCDVALDIIHYVKEHGLQQPAEPRRRKERRDKGVMRGPRGGAKGPATKGRETKAPETKGKPSAKRKAGESDRKAPAKPGLKPGKASKVSTLAARKKAKVDVKKAKSRTAQSGGVTVVKPGKKK